VSISFEVLGSSSKGNCHLLRTAQSNVLVDVGFSGKATAALLEQRGLSVDDIHAIFITHEHNDHCNGLRSLSQFENVSLFANRKTAETISEKLNRDISWTIFENESKFYFRDFEVVAFSLPHDAADPVGYVFSSPTCTCCNASPCDKICIMTDLGHTPQGLTRYTDDVDWLILEANHDLRLLELDLRRPAYIKNRIRGKYGHLSNEAAMSFISKNYSPRWKKIIFVHLSGDCNKPEVIHSMLGKYDFPKNLRFEIIDPAMEIDSRTRASSCVSFN
jgi:phosphoribosyl 1,2-cyclic phosphodiesterase